MVDSVLITGANSGLGREAARQLAVAGTKRVVLACRNPTRAEAAKAQLERQTGHQVFEVLVMDTSDSLSVRDAVGRLDGRIEALVMNAGGLGGRTPGAVNVDGATHIFAANVIGHAVLLDELVGAGKLTRVALFAGAEAARGIPMLKMERPVLDDPSVEAFVSMIDGTFFGAGLDPMKAFPYVKLIAALWTSAAARQYPQLRVLSMSPGGSAGSAMSDVPWLLRLVLRGIVQPTLKLMGRFHDLETGARRYLDALENPKFESGTFYGSPFPGLTGEPVDQATIFPLLGDPTAQEHASEAVHRFTGQGRA